MRRQYLIHPPTHPPTYLPLLFHPGNTLEDFDHVLVLLDPFLHNLNRVVNHPPPLPPYWVLLVGG